MEDADARPKAECAADTEAETGLHSRADGVSTRDAGAGFSARDAGASFSARDAGACQDAASFESGYATDAAADCATHEGAA